MTFLPSENNLSWRQDWINDVAIVTTSANSFIVCSCILRQSKLRVLVALQTASSLLCYAWAWAWIVRMVLVLGGWLPDNALRLDVGTLRCRLVRARLEDSWLWGAFLDLFSDRLKFEKYILNSKNKFTNGSPARAQIRILVSWFKFGLLIVFSIEILLELISFRNPLR